MDIIGGSPIQKVTLSGTTSSGSLTVTSSDSVGKKIVSIAISPANAGTTYKFGLKETSATDYLMKARGTYTGNQILKSDNPIYSDSFDLEISSASADELFSFDVRYE